MEKSLNKNANGDNCQAARQGRFNQKRAIPRDFVSRKILKNGAVGKL
jgi:hypothetical protein